MGLLSPQDEATLKQHLSVITLPVELVLFTQTFGGSESGDVAKQILGELASLNDKVTIVEKNFVLDTEDKAKYKVDKALHDAKTAGQSNDTPGDDPYGAF